MIGGGDDQWLMMMVIYYYDNGDHCNGGLEWIQFGDNIRQIFIYIWPQCIVYRLANTFFLERLQCSATL